MESDSAQVFLRKFMSPKTIAEAKKHNKNFSWIKWFSFGNGLIRPACAGFRNDVADGKFFKNNLKELDEMFSQTMGKISMQEDIMRFLVKFCGYSGAESDYVRKKISKKKGTLDILSEIESRFIKYSSVTYSIPEDKCREISSSVIQTIKDASNYGFSWNHSDAYSCVGYICGYLRYYYPTEFITTALNVFSDKEEKSQKIVKYAQKMGYKIEPPKFRKSIDKYTFEPDIKVIYKGLNSIKYVNYQSTMELYGLRFNEFKTFTDLLVSICEDTKVDARQMRVLISIDFFSEFGKNKKLLDIFEVFNSKYKRTYVEKTKVGRIEFIKSYEHESVNESLNILDQMKLEMEYMGYIALRANCHKRYCLILSVDVKYSPRVSLYCINSGKTVECKVDKKYFAKHKFKDGIILYTEEFQIKPDYSFVDGKYVRKGTSSYVLTKYHGVEFCEFEKIISGKSEEIAIPGRKEPNFKGYCSVDSEIRK